MNIKPDSDTTVAVFGLTGDPFTVAHRQICKQAMDCLPIDKLYVIPTVVDYHRQGKERWLSDEARLLCAKSMLWSLGEFYQGKWEIDTYELDLKCQCGLLARLHSGEDLEQEIIAPRRFLHTLLDFKCRIGIFKQVMLILGTDSIKNLMTWYRWKDVCRNVSSLVVVNGRDGEDIEIPAEVREEVGSHYCNLPLDNDELLKVSASKVRKACIKHGYTLGRYLDIVEDYDFGAVGLEELKWI